MNDSTVAGLGNSEPDGYLETVVSAAGRPIRADPEPEEGCAKRGMPALQVTE